MEKNFQKNQQKNIASLVETVDNGCPICEGIVKGNDKYLFFCKKCNILFQRNQLKTKREKIKE